MLWLLFDMKESQDNLQIHVIQECIINIYDYTVK